MKELIKKILKEEKSPPVFPNLKGEMDDIERGVQDLNRHHHFDVSVKDMIDAFRESDPQQLSDHIWEKLNNTESNQIEKGDFKKVFYLADKYDKSSPLKLAKKLIQGTYKYPLIVRFNDQYHLIAGNTRLITAAALGITPMVFIADVNKPYPVDEGLIKKTLKNYIYENI